MKAPTGSRGLLVLLAVGVVAVAGVAAMGPGTTPSGEAVLNDTVERYAGADTVVGTVAVTASNDTANATATVDFAAAENGSRVVVETTSETYRAGTNGTVAWYVGPNRTVVRPHDSLAGGADRYDGASPATLLNRTAANTSVDYLRTDTDDGTAAHVVRVTHDNESDDRQTTLWVAQNDSRLLRAVGTDGTNRTVLDYRETQFNVSVHDSTFDPPADRVAVTAVERYDSFESAQANTSLALPQLDATFEAATAVERPTESGVFQQYTAAGDNVSVVSTTADREFADGNATTVTVDGHDANVTTVRDAAVVYWQTDGVTTALLVDADEDRAVELARSVAE